MKRLVKKMPKLVAIVLALALMAPIALKPIDAKAYGQWYQTAYGWRFYDYSEGYLTGFWRIDGQYYYFNSSGYMVTGWVEFNDGYWRYFQPGSGAAAMGWHNIGGTWYFFLSNQKGGMATGWWTIDGLEYYFESSGAMYCGWKYLSNAWRYFQPGSGHMVMGWNRIGGQWYYLDPDNTGAMCTGYKSIGGTLYYFDSNGAMYTGWLNWGTNDWYYYDSSGAEVSGWRQIGGVWYYFEPDFGNQMSTGFKDIGGATYYFGTSGAMRTGWQLISAPQGNVWYYFSSSGAMVKNQWIGNYYMKSDGAMATNEWIGQYYVGADGVWIPGYRNPNGTVGGTDPSIANSGWKLIGGEWYYYKNGIAVTGFHEINGVKYYFYEEGELVGAMATYWVWVDGEYYYFDVNGKMYTGWLEEEGVWYYFDATTGKMATNQWVGDCYIGPDGYWIPWYTDDVTSQLNILRNYILDYGVVNSDGNKVINFTDTSNAGTEYIIAIIYNSETESFQFCAGAEGGISLSYLEMPASGNIVGQNLYPEFQYADENGLYCDAIATINAGTYYEGCTVDFTVLETIGMTNDSIQQLANAFLQLGFAGWEILLEDAGLTLHDIGFIAY